MNEGISFKKDYNLPIIDIGTINRNYRVGEIKYNKYGSMMEVVRYRKEKDIDVLITTQLASGEIRQYLWEGNTYSNFKKGNILSPFDMLLRCYDENTQTNRQSYIGCTVNPWFHNFQNFCEWCEYNYYEVPGERMCLDKDILYPGNKEYGPITCIWVPNKINTLFTFNQCTNTSGYPGIAYSEERHKYCASLSSNNNKVNLGRYETLKEAKIAYKLGKEAEIKRVTNLFKYYLPEFVYYILMNYEINI